MAREETNQCAVGETPAPLSLADQLTIKKNKIAREANAKCSALARQITLLKQTDSEAIIKRAEEMLYE